ncbi:MAG TPA: hypothetical protein VF270_07160, partial [Ignavibacteriaceae bacterium]
AFLKLSSPSWDSYRIIFKYNDVFWIGENRKVEHLPDSLKGVIKPIVVKKEQNIIKLEYYLWDEVKLKKVILYYHNNNVNVKLKTVWNSGRRLSSG